MHYKQLHNSSWLVGIALLIVFLVIWRPLLRPGIMATHDGENHLARFANYYLAVKQGQIPPRFAPNLLNRYGYPVFDFNYPLANIASLPFSILQINYEITFKLIVLLSIASGSIGVFCWLRQLQTRLIPSALAIAAYISAPYILSAVLFRGSIGEVMVYGLLPWLFWLIERIKTSSRLSSLIVGIPLVSALLLAHNVTGLLAVAILGIYALSVWGKKIKFWQTGGILLLFSLGLTLWFWLPALIETQATIVFAARVQQEYAQHFVSIHQLLFSPLTFGYSLAGPVDTLSMSLGWVSILTLYCSMVLTVVWICLLRRFSWTAINRHHTILVLILLSFLLIVMQTFSTQTLWDAVGFLRVIQFPWRLTLFVPIVLLPVFASLWQLPSRILKGVLLLGLFLQLSIAAKVIAQPTIHHSNEEYEAASYSTSTQNENRPRNFTFEYFNHESDWQPTASIMSGTGTIEKVLHWSGSNRSYILNAQTPVTLVEPTMNFAGWQTTQKKLEPPVLSTAVKYIDSDEIGGRVAYTVPAGRYEMTTRFTQNTPARIVGNGLFIIFVIGYGFICWQCIHREKIKDVQK